MRLSCSLIVLIAASGLHAQVRPSAVFLNAPTSQVIAGDSLQVTAAAYDSNGTQVSTSYSWSSSNTSVLAVDGNGVVHALTLGWADISATASGIRGTIRLQVVPLAINVNPFNAVLNVGDTLAFSADVLDINGQALSNVPLQWRAWGPNAGQNNGVTIDKNSGFVNTAGFGIFYIEASFHYTVGGGPYIQDYYGNTQLTVQIPSSFRAVKLFDSSPVRQNFQLLPRRGTISVNDSGQIAYVGWLEGLAPAALRWDKGAFLPVAIAGQPTEFPGSVLMDIDAPAINSNGEIATHVIVAPIRNAMMYANAAGTPRLLLLDGSTGGGVTNLRNFQTTQYGLNDSSLTAFRADYWNLGTTVSLSGLFTMDAKGIVTTMVPAGTKLDGFTATYNFDRDFGLANDGTLLFFVSNGSTRALYRMTPDGAIKRVIATGDSAAGRTILNLGSVAVGRNGDYSVIAGTSGQAVLLLFHGDPGQHTELQINWGNVMAVSSSGEVAFSGDAGAGYYGAYRWDGSSLQTVSVSASPSPSGDPYTQFDAAGFTATGDLILQTHTANNLLVVVDTGTRAAPASTVVFQTGDPVNYAPAGPDFYNFVLNSHAGNPMVKTGWFTTEVFEAASGALLPRLVNQTRLPDGWFYEGNQDVRRNADGDLFVSTDQSITQISPSGSKLLAHFPQRGAGGTVNTGYQVVANTSGTVVSVGGTNFGTNQMSIISKGTAQMIAYLGTNPSYRTSSPGGGYFTGSNDVGVDENGAVYAILNVSGGPNGLFQWTPSGGWTALLKVGDSFDGRTVTNVQSLHVAGTACTVLVATTANLSHVSRYQNGQWSDIVNYGDGFIAGGTISFLGVFDANRKGAVAATLNVNGTGYLAYYNGNDIRVVADNDHPLPNGDVIIQFFQVSMNDDGRIFATGINQIDQLVLYEFDPQF
jgi:hypothetical protein